MGSKKAKKHQGHVPADYMLCTNDACSVHGFSGADVPSGKCPACGSKLAAGAPEVA